MKLLLSTILLAIFIPSQSFGCSCKDLGELDSLRVKGYNHSELVFLGELIDYDSINYSYTFKVYDTYKGSIKTTLIKGKYFDRCSKFPKDKCKWIVYADYKTSEYIDISQCLSSRSIMNPTCVSCYLPPPPPGVTNYDFDYDKAQEELRKQAEIDWYKEVEILEKLKEKE